MSDKLVVLWTSGDREVAQNMVFMYTLNAKKQRWFDEVTLIVWGPSDKLLAEDESLQAGIQSMLDEGIRIESCLRCAENFGVVDELRDLGIDVKLMGEPLSDYLKKDYRVLSC